MLIDDKATLPSPPTAPTAGLCRRLLGKRGAINAASFITGIIATGIAYTALSMIVGMGLGAGILYQAETIRLETGIISSPQDLVPAIGSVSSVLLAAVVFSVAAGAIVCGRTAYRSTRRWLIARLGQEG